MLDMNDIDISSLDLNLLKALRFLLEEKSVSRAAKRMHVSQSAMSHTLSRLREAFADPLFVRVSRGLEPTERAVELYPSVCEILEQIGSLLQPIEFSPELWNGRLVIHTHDFIVSGYLAKRLANLYRAAPNLNVELAELNDESYQQLEVGKVDLILAAGLGVSPHHRQRHLFDDEIVCICDAGHPLCELSPAEVFFDFPHVQLKMLENIGDPISSYARKNGLNRIINIQTDTLNIQPGLLQNTQLLAFVPKVLADQVCITGTLRFLRLPFDSEPITVRGFWHDRHQNDAAMMWFRNLILQPEGTQ